MYLRYVSAHAVAGMRAREEIFQAASDLVHEPEADHYAAEQAQELRLWFAENLKRPGQFLRGARMDIGRG